jgi:hypothetical protein
MVSVSVADRSGAGIALSFTGVLLPGAGNGSVFWQPASRMLPPARRVAQEIICTIFTGPAE